MQPVVGARELAAARDPCGRLNRLRIVVDYRPALRARTGVGEYIHQIVKALSETDTVELTLFTSSWKDRPSSQLATELPAVRIADHRIPVRALNLAWHRLGWPHIERITGGSYDVAHSPHPLLMPSRSAARVITIHDLHFLTHPERTTGEIRRDYASLARAHAQRADRVIVPSPFTAREAERVLRVPFESITVCPTVAPSWRRREGSDRNSEGYILFLGTLEPRKNFGGLLEAYGRLLSRLPSVPKLVVAGGAGPGSVRWLEQLEQPPFAGRVEYLGYVATDRRESLYRGAQLLVLPSFEEGFGLPVLEAMAAGVPVVASNRGAIPDVLGNAGLLIDPGDTESLVVAMKRMLTEPGMMELAVQRGLERIREFSPARAAAQLRLAYSEAVRTRQGRSADRSHAHRR
jgi:glycosyltransferase involved in cell wall biosynthesis